MQVIPVIDLLAGAVVHARGGDRERYGPVRSQLCAGTAPLEVARALLDVYPFASLYVADLDAIAGRGDNFEQLAAIRRAWPQLELWVDCGLADAQSCRAWREKHGATPVLGTETMRDAGVIGELGAEEDWVLSLDYLLRPFSDPSPTLLRPRDWPARVIVMTLGRVGSEAGPDLARLAEIKALAEGRKVFAAGGVRGGEDLRALARAGAGGVLIATALHERRIGRAEIAAVAAGPA